MNLKQTARLIEREAFEVPFKAKLGANLADLITDTIGGLIGLAIFAATIYGVAQIAIRAATTISAATQYAEQHKAPPSRAALHPGQALGSASPWTARSTQRQ